MNRFCDVRIEGQVIATLQLNDGRKIRVGFDTFSGEVSDFRPEGSWGDFDHALLEEVSHVIDFDRVGNNLIDTLEAAIADIASALETAEWTETEA